MPMIYVATSVEGKIVAHVMRFEVVELDDDNICMSKSPTGRFCEMPPGHDGHHFAMWDETGPSSLVKWD